MGLFSFTKPINKSESEKMVEQYLSTEKDIKYLEEKYDDFVIRSLEVEYDQYKKYVDSYFPASGEFQHWMFSEIRADKFKLVKKSSTTREDISVNGSYSFTNGNFDLKSLFVSVNFNSVNLKKNKFDEIIAKYILYWKIKEIEKDRERNKQSFNKMVTIIGKDVKRDSLIDQILSK